MKSSRSSADVIMLGTFSAWNLGTLQARALPMASALKSRGVNIAVVTTPWDAPDEAGVIDVIGGVPLINTRSTSTKQPVNAIREQLDWIRILKPRLVHLMKPKGFGGLAAQGAPRHTPLVVDSDDWEGDGGWNDTGKYSWTQQRVFHAQEQHLLKRADVVTAASTLLAQRARALRGSSANVHLVVNGINASRVRDLSSARQVQPSRIVPPVVVLYSRFEEFPHDWLARFVQELSVRSTQDVTVRVIGRDRLASDPPVSVWPVVTELLGYVASQAVPELLGSAAVAIYPYQDSLVTRSKQSVKLLELLAAGCPLVASDVGDVPLVVGGAGLLVQDADPIAFAVETAKLLDQPQRMDGMSEAGRTRVRDRFTIEAVSEQLMRAYRSAGLS